MTSQQASINVPHRPGRSHNSHNHRLWRVGGTVLLAHVALLWAMEQGWLEQAPIVEEAQVIMASVMVESQRVESPTPPAPQAKPQPKSVTPTVPQPRPTPTPTPLPTASKQAEASPFPPVVAPVVAPTSSSPSTSISTSTSAAAPSPSVGKPAPPSLVLPSSDADYQNNPPPTYPRMSKRLGEQGTVTVRVFIGLQGTAEQAEIRTSSGYDRLDKAALETVQRWRYVPGKRHGSPEAMWFNVPVRFVLE
ncbi:MAG: TonB family protein [Pseudomonadota bacterium]